MNNPAAVRWAQIEATWHPANFPASRARMASAGSERCAFAVASISAAGEGVPASSTVRRSSLDECATGQRGEHMCGIAGILAKTGHTIDRGALERMAEVMHHRGPDASGIWHGHAPIGFAHTRLSLFDLSSAADQPWTDGTDALVFNGEIYNFRALRASLEREGATFRSNSDTEVLFAALQVHGVRRAVEVVEGMFAFAYYEAASETTYLCRDRFGIKPLLYLERPGELYFASEVKALQAATDTSLDEVLTLLALRTLGDKSQVRTLFRDVRQVAPGQLVTVREGTITNLESYDPLLDQIDVDEYHRLDRASAAEIADELEQLLTGAVDRMAACDARLGAFLSGGVDSSLISAIAVHQGHEHFRGFTSNVVGPASELAAASKVARSLGLPLSTSTFKPQDWIRDWVRCTWHLETPVITNPSAVPFSRVAALAHEEGYKAVLTGEGADELFLGYPRLASRAAERIAGAPYQALRRIYRRVPGLSDAILNERDAASNDFLRGIAGGFEETELLADATDRYGFLPSQAASLHARSATMVQTSLQALLQRNDRMGMSASIESRFPFLDEKVVRFALNLPVRHKLQRSRELHDPKHPFVVDKAPVRGVASRYLDQSLARRRKNGFPTAGLHGVRVRSEAFSGSWSAEAFGGGRSFERALQDWQHPYDLAKLVSIEVFGRLFGAGEPIDAVEGWLTEAVAPIEGRS